MKIEILNVKSVTEDKNVSSLVGTRWDVQEVVSGGIIINVGMELLLKDGEYKTIN